MNRIFALDMDGTLLTSKEKIHPATIKILTRTKKLGHTNIIATGRPFWDIHDVVKDYNLFSYYVCNNGAYIYDVNNQKYLFDQIIPIKIFDILLKIINKYNTIFIVHTNKNTYRTIIANKYIDFDHPDWEEAKKFKIISLDKIIAKLPFEKITQLSIRSTKDVIMKIYNSFKQYKDIVDCFISNNFYFDVNPKNTSKFLGIKKIAKLLGHNTNNVVAFGDSDNDLEMLKMSGHGFCMSNGTKIAKEHADEIIANNDTNSIALKIAEFL